MPYNLINIKNIFSFLQERKVGAQGERNSHLIRTGLFMGSMRINFVFNYFTYILGSIKISKATVGSLLWRFSSSIPNTLVFVQNKAKT